MWGTVAPALLFSKWEVPFTVALDCFFGICLLTFAFGENGLLGPKIVFRDSCCCDKSLSEGAQGEIMAVQNKALNGYKRKLLVIALHALYSSESMVFMIQNAAMMVDSI